MEKRVLGQTNFQVSVIGFGGIPIQRVDEKDAPRLIESLVENGINFIDTARGYTNSESLIGEALEKIGRDKFILATKSMRRDYEGMVEDVEISLKELRTDYIDIYQFHNIRTQEELDTILGENGAYRALEEMKARGLIGEIGITGHSPELLDKAIDTGKFATIQCPYNPVERQAEDLFEKAKALNIGVIVMKPLAGGAISKGDLSLRFILENSNVSLAIPGMDTLDQVRINSMVGKDRRPLTGEEEKDLFEETDSLAGHFCRRCGYCLPCPEGIDIPVQFLMEGYYTRYNLKDWAKIRYDAMETKASNCIECGICESKCPYDLPIREMLKNVTNVLG